MIKLREVTLEEAKVGIEQNQLYFLYLYGTHCSVCHALLPQVEEVLENFPQIKREKLNVHEIPEAAGAFSVFTIPVLLLYVEGKETIREARFVNIESLRSSLQRITNMLD
ncbi:thioredoxin family protein [Bacillus sp. RAR_GA_16]|uniref:thioredoxin family protein n=1 Tax=Bacillus sp. RAR_GA_16 TaxID=2876774 RepID=UPI001CCD099B|nr:thioredoxin family protein [Bacillus sp. RAR_GA_16]MCA0172419.1 thioredoxin family protein [Bacillus sp. RAR_GA_16]